MTDAEKERAVDALLAEAAQRNASDAEIIFGEVPAWVPPPTIKAAWRTASGLLADGATPEQIREAVDRILADDDLESVGLEGAACLPLPFIRAVHELASFVYGVSMGEVDGLRFLAGDQAELGQRFKPKGRPESAVREVIRERLAANPAMKNQALWDEIKKNPPTGWWAVGYGNEGRFVSPEGDYMSRRRFDNVCSEERKNSFLTG